MEQIADFIKQLYEYFFWEKKEIYKIILPFSAVVNGTMMQSNNMYAKMKMINITKEG